MKSDKEIREIVRSVIKEFITRGDLRNIEAHADNLFKNVNVDVEFSSHFLDRVNDPRNGDEILSDELIGLFTKTYSKYGQKIPNFKSGTEAVINDMNSNINIPFSFNFNREKGEFEMVGKTVMRKKDFMTPNLKLKV